MSIFLQTRFEYLFDVPSTSSQPNKKRWHLAFATIYCSRAINSLTKIPISNKISRSPSFIAVNVRPDNSTFKINQTTLVQLVKEKNYKQLRQLGGVAGVASAAETHLEGGIHGDVDDIARRQEAFGSNTYKKPPTKNFFHFVIEAFKDITIAILLGCAALSLGFGIKEHGLKEGWYDGGSIFVAVFLVIAVSAVSNYRQNRQFDKLSKISNNIQIDVMRSGRRQQVSIFELVVGDVVCLKIGDQVPADGLFIDGHSLQIDESSMTGESDHVEINHDQNPFLVSGTKVADGYGSMLITSVGMNTTWGEMMSHISRDTDEQTPLQARLNKLTSSIGKVGLAVAFLVLLVLLVRYFTGNTQDENGNREFNGSRTKADDIVNAVVGIVAAAVTIVVVAIPEGLPLAVTLTLAYSMKRMMADQAMVRKLSACETMGSATTICTDKTGTLTMNLMKVTKFFLGQEPTEQSNTSSISPYVIELVKQGVALNTTGRAYRANTESEFEFSGSPTEKAILSWASMDLKMDMEEQKHSFVVLHVEAFNSHKKRSGVLVRKKLDNTIHVHWKGAAEMILAMCSSYYDASGIMKDLDDHQRNVFKQIIQGMAADSLRCIAFAHTHISEERHQDGKEEKKLKETGLTLLGLVGIKDPCRPGVKKAVDDCQHAGVNIKMITGDNVFTARAIAIECGILKPGQDMFSGAVVEGEEFRNYTPEERMEKVDKICVMARSSPFDKLLMVQCLKQKGHVVAVTGDGTNDAPALKEADIGLSMEIQGTEVAKESSDIVILDDNFASMATVLRWGRCVYNNIQKFIQFQLTVNVAALVINFVSAVSAGEVPLTAVQLLWVNLIMDTLGALALATEQPAKELMDKPPVGRIEPLITNIMWRNLLAQALYQITVLLTLQFRGEGIFGVTEKVNDTLIFNIFVLCQVFNEFNARKLEKKNVFKGIHKNKLFLGIIGITIVLQVLMVEFLRKFADTERLNWGQWGLCIGVAALSWPIGWAVKHIPVPEKPIFSYFNCLNRMSTQLHENLVLTSITRGNPSDIDPTSLSKLTEEKNFDQLTSFGGVNGIAVALKSDVKKGIKGVYDDCIDRRRNFGTNTYETPPAKSLIHFVLKAIKDPMIILVVVCGVISLGFGIANHGLSKGWIDGGSIFLALSLVIIASSVSNFWPNRQFNKLSQIKCSIEVGVIRNGWRQQIPADQIVVGDVVCLRRGNKIPADGLFLQGHPLSVESSLRRNSDLEEVTHQKPFLHSGSMVVDGYAQMLVTSVGMNTAWGRMIRTKCKTLQETTPVQAKLRRITSITSKVGLVVALFVFVFWSVQYFMGKKPNGYVRGETKFCDAVCEMVRILAAVVAIAAGAVAEGLPLAVVITLAYSMKSMTKNKAIVRKHSAVEAIASTTTICTILNRMTVTKFWLGQGFIEPTASSRVPSNMIELLHQAVGLHTTQPPSEVSSFIWTPVEKAIIYWAIQEMGMNTRELQESCSILYVKAFDSVKTRSGFLMKKKNDNTIHVHWKGTPEAILVMCSKYYDTTGIVKAIDYDTREKLNQIAQKMATDGFQCIAFAHEKTSRDVYQDGISHQVLEDDCLTFLGFVGVKDVCRPRVRKAVEDFQYAGVNIKMVTREDALIAKAIATECGILNPDQKTESEVVGGVEFQNYTQEERMEKVEKIRVMASASPVDILLMVRCLKQKGHVVAVIGNYTVDATALREADIGISVGLQSTDAAKESSDIVILDDDFVSVVDVLKWGRTMFDHIQIYAQFHLTASITSVVIDFVTAISAREPLTIKTAAAISSGEIPFAALQVLWVKLIIGTLAALALTIGQPSKKLMKRPVNRKPLITNIMWRNISAQSIYHIAILLTIQFKGKEIFSVNDKVKDTMMFNTFVLCQIFTKFNARELKKQNIFMEIHRNKLFLGIIGAIVIVQVVMVEFLKRFAGTERLNWGQWGVSIAIAAMSWPVAMYVKWIPVPKKPFLNYLKWKN